MPPENEPTENKPTETQPAPNISTEHQAPGDARRPGDTLDKDQPDTGPDHDTGPDTGDDARKSSLTRNE